MNQIAIYVEGGGDTAHQRAELRNGFDQLLNAQKQAARDKRMSWKLVPSGVRQAAYDDFVNAIRQADDRTLCVLLVDSEAKLRLESRKPKRETREARRERELSNALVRRDHLVKHDNWDFFAIPPEHIYLMVLCMEAWIVSDREQASRIDRPQESCCPLFAVCEVHCLAR